MTQRLGALLGTTIGGGSGITAAHLAPALYTLHYGIAVLVIGVLALALLCAYDLGKRVQKEDA